MESLFQLLETNIQNMDKHVTNPHQNMNVIKKNLCLSAKVAKNPHQVIVEMQQCLKSGWVHRQAHTHTLP